MLLLYIDKNYQIISTDSITLLSLRPRIKAIKEFCSQRDGFIKPLVLRGGSLLQHAIGTLQIVVILLG